MVESRSVMLDAGDIQVPAEVDGPESSDRVHFLLTHGAGGDRNTAGLKALSLGLAEHGYLVVRPDLPYRAAGRSTPPLAERSVPGFNNIVASAREQFGPDALWVVGGRSYGGRVASLAVAGGLDAAGLLLYSYPLAPARELLRAPGGSLAADPRPVAVSGRHARPVLRSGGVQPAPAGAGAESPGPRNRGRGPQPSGCEGQLPGWKGPLGVVGGSKSRSGRRGLG